MDLSLQKLEKALALRKHIHELEAQLNSLFGGTQTRASRTSAGKKRKKKGGLTPAGRRKLSQMMKARWAARKKAAGKK